MAKNLLKQEIMRNKFIFLVCLLTIVICFYTLTKLNTMENKCRQYCVEQVIDKCNIFQPNYTGGIQIGNQSTYPNTTWFGT